MIDIRVDHISRKLSAGEEHGNNDKHREKTGQMKAAAAHGISKHAHDQKAEQSTDHGDKDRNTVRHGQLFAEGEEVLITFQREFTRKE